MNINWKRIVNSTNEEVHWGRGGPSPLRPGWMALMPGWLVLRPSHLALRPSWLAKRSSWLALGGMDVWMDVQT